MHSDPFCKRLGWFKESPPDGSRWIVQVRSTSDLGGLRNPTDGSRWMRSDPFYKRLGGLRNPTRRQSVDCSGPFYKRLGWFKESHPTAVGGLFRSVLFS